MKKIVLSLACGLSLMYSNSDISVTTGKKDYTNSKTKIDGTTLNLNLSHKYEDSKISLGYLKDDVNRENSTTKAAIESLHVKKYNGLYSYNLTQNIDMKLSYIKIIDNLAPTNQGKVYGLGGGYKLPKGFGVKLDIYKSDYETFDVNQYDLTLYKGFKIGDTKAKFSVLAKSINIDGDKYSTYLFKDKDYFTTAFNLGFNHNGYVAGIGTMIGKRIFTVLDDGQKVQHHAMEQDKTYMASFGKKFENFDIIAKYTYQNGKELPEKQDDVDTKVTSLTLNYKF